MPYFSERELGARPRTIQEVTPGAWKGIAATVIARVQDGSFARAYGEQCPDGRGVTGTDAGLMGQAVEAYFPGLRWPLDPDHVPRGLEGLDLIEFCYEKIAGPEPHSFHSFFGHSHLAFDVEQGRAAFRDEVNTIFSRNGLAFSLEENGQVIRLAPPALGEALVSVVFKTGDSTLDGLLESARAKFLSHDPNVRRESLEKLWDAWERLKTIEPGKDKAESTSRLLDKCCGEPNFRQLL